MTWTDLGDTEREQRQRDLSIAVQQQASLKQPLMANLVASGFFKDVPSRPKTHADYYAEAMAELDAAYPADRGA